MKAEVLKMIYTAKDIRYKHDIMIDGISIEYFKDKQYDLKNTYTVILFKKDYAGSKYLLNFIFSRDSLISKFKFNGVNIIETDWVYLDIIYNSVTDTRVISENDLLVFIQKN